MVLPLSIFGALKYEPPKPRPVYQFLDTDTGVPAECFEVQTEFDAAASWMSAAMVKWETEFEEQSREPIARLAAGILDRRKAAWFEGGTKYSKAQMEEASREWASAIFHAAHKVSDNPYLSKKPWTLNPWAMAGIICLESNFDRYAIGPYTRNWAYDHPASSSWLPKYKRLTKGVMLKRNRLTISHSADDVKRVIRSKEWQRQFGSVDAGMCQWVGKWNVNDLDLLFQLDSGSLACAWEMRRRGTEAGISRVWLNWHRAGDEEYAERVEKAARRLGAKEGEI
jgi:hypothetical protein